MLITYCLTRYTDSQTHTHTYALTSRVKQVPQTLQQASEATIISLLVTFVSISFMAKRSSCLFSSSSDTSQLARVTLTSAFISSGLAAPPAPWVESCSCPPGYAGQFCELCVPGFTREDPGRGPLSTCVPCNCHQHGTCHPETGNHQNINIIFRKCATEFL